MLPTSLIMANALQLTFLGTGSSLGSPVVGCPCAVCQSQAPEDHRLRSSVLLTLGKSRLLIDCSPDFRQQALRVPLVPLHAVLLTHLHRDHVGGLDDLRSLAWSSNVPLPIYLSAARVKPLQQAYPYIWSGASCEFASRLPLCGQENIPFQVASGIQIIPLSVQHGSLPIWGFRVGKLAYLTDVSVVPSETLQQLKGLEVLVLGALQQAPHYKHLHLAAAIQLARKIGAQRTFFTHIGHGMGRHAEVTATLPAHMHLAYDALCLKGISLA